MELVLLDLDRAVLLRGDLLAGGVLPTIELRSDDEAAAVRRVRDQVDDDLVRAQGAAPPVDRDEREHSVLDLVPLVRARREVADPDRDPELVSEPLQLSFPDTGSVPIAAASVGRDEQLARVGIALRTHLLPPCLDGRGREHRGVMVGADVDEAIVGGEVVDAVRNRLADRVTGKSRGRRPTRVRPWAATRDPRS